MHAPNKSEEQGQGDSEPKQGDAGSHKEEEPKKEGEPKKEFKWTPLKIIILSVIVIVALVLGIRYYIYSSDHEQTDDAYTSGHIHNISSRVDGTVIRVLVDDNYEVKAGQVLVQLDPTDFKVRVDKAQADFDRAKADFNRVYALKDDRAISKQDYDQTHDAVATAATALTDAQNQLRYCTIVAPSDGFIGHKAVEVGNRITVGGAIMAVVQDTWVVANFKETQLGEMKIGQRAEIQVDAIPKKTFYGTIDSFSPGSGAVFALLPPDNATGNFTKIVQRVPVKIVFDPKSVEGFRGRILPGLSVEATIDIKDQNPPPSAGPAKFGL